ASAGMDADPQSAANASSKAGSLFLFMNSSFPVMIAVHSVPFLLYIKMRFLSMQELRFLRRIMQAVRLKNGMQDNFLMKIFRKLLKIKKKCAIIYYIW
ncbi:MAG: hypothetical protein J6P20_08970, partial [Oscillospiraceae bacterium]|nr:hypothetical protein [Oscillospiraceae bacterium]